MAGETSTYTILESAIKNSDEEIIQKILNTILTDGKKDLKDIDIIRQLLSIKNDNIKKLTAQWIADLAKVVENRNQLTDSDIIKTLLSSLNNQTASDCNIQICRALANICCENGNANKYLVDFEALEKLTSFIESNVNTDSVELLNVACGFLLNYLTSNYSSLEQKVVDLKILNLVEKIITLRVKSLANCENLFVHLLYILSYISQVLSDTWFSNELCLHLVNILEVSTNANISELCLELLSTEAENDDIKLFLAKASLCELLFNLLEKHKDLVQDADGRALLKSACDLIVLILTGDESMTYLYNDGNGRVYNDMLTWLDSDDVDLMSSAILAIGNFGRNDSHCIKMVENGLAETLLRILSKYNDVNTDVRIQHALLSALRNLVIPSANKERIIKGGLIDIMYPLIHSTYQVVIFKLIGTLRMLIDGQAETALSLATKVDFLEKLVDWSFNSDHTGVRSEALRLLAWLIKHCHSTKPFPIILSVDKCIKCLVEMLSSPHALMQNEALLALNIICAAYFTETDNQTELGANIQTDNTNKSNQKAITDPKSELSKTLVEDNIGKFLTFLLTRHGNDMQKEIIANLITLVEHLVQISILKEHLKADEFPDAFKKLLERETVQALHDRIKTVLSCIDAS